MGELMDQIASGGPPLIPLAEIPGALALTAAYLDDHRNRRHRPESETYANAQLIVAAPEMLEVLRRGDGDTFAATLEAVANLLTDPRLPPCNLVDWLRHKASSIRAVVATAGGRKLHIRDGLPCGPPGFLRIRALCGVELDFSWFGENQEMLYQGEAGDHPDRVTCPRCLATISKAEGR